MITADDFVVYNLHYPKILKCFNQFGLGCPPRLRINPYKGCGYKCQFCYVTEDPEESSKTLIEDLKYDLNLVQQVFKTTDVPIMIACSTDPFQPLELTQKCSLRVIKLLTENQFPIIIMTQNPGILLSPEYWEVIKDSKNIVVEVTISSTTTDGVFSSIAPSCGEKLNAMAALYGRGIATRLRLEPIIPDVSKKGGILNNGIDVIINAYATILVLSSSK